MSAQAETRRALLAAGFWPLPCGGKKPLIDKWPTTEASTADIALWDRLYPAARNTGILCKNAPALDIDILDLDAAADVETIARDFLDGRGRILTRYGRAPKRAILLRAEAPIAKIETLFTSGEKIEFLGAGQQIIAFGTHPDTRKPYTWHGGAPGEITRADLPSIDEAEARRLVQTTTDMLVGNYGYQVASTSKRQGERTAGEEWHRRVCEPIVEGQRHTTLVQVTGHLLRHYVDPQVVLELMHAWNVTRCLPPLDPKHVANTVNDIAGREMLRRKGTHRHG
jgi:hypothetical protein